MEFIKQYWWCFLILAIVVFLVIFGLVFGATQTKKESNCKKSNNNETLKQDKIEEITKKEEPTLDSTADDTKELNKKGEMHNNKSEKSKIENKIVEETTPKTANKSKETANNKVEVKKEDKPERKQKYMVIYDKENKNWIVKKTDSSRASKRCKTKAEALEVATRLSESQELSLTVKKKDGKFQKQR